MRILIVDDEFGVLRSARRVLSGHETFIASDSSSAIGIAARHQPDAILLDVLLGGESGLDAIPSLMAASPRSAIVVMTGMATDVAMHLAYASGADAFVPKEDLRSVPGVLADLFSEKRLPGEP